MNGGTVLQSPHVVLACSADSKAGNGLRAAFTCGYTIPAASRAGGVPPEISVPSIRAFRVASRLGLTTTLLVFGLIVIGSVVRTTGSGLACPDWPLCQGRWIPPLEPHVLIEWFHRLLALLVSLALVATAAWIMIHSALRPRLGGLAMLALALLMLQITLGALTVWKLLDPGIVGGHLAVALLLFATLLTLTLAAREEAETDQALAVHQRPPGLLATCTSATLMTYGQAMLGGIVSSHHAGLACPDWPACNGELFPPLSGLVGLQMLHRYGAYALTTMMVFTAVRTRATPDPRVRAAGMMALRLTVAQVVLGVLSVLLGAPSWLSAAHLANAVAILAMLVVSTFRVAAMPAATAGFATAAAR